MEFGFRAVSEQFSPTELLQQATDVERVGFDFITISDHFHPWFHTEAQSPFSWVWIASAAQATNKIHIGTGVTSPIFRYNPAVIARALKNLMTAPLILGYLLSEPFSLSKLFCARLTRAHLP